MGKTISKSRGVREREIAEEGKEIGSEIKRYEQIIREKKYKELSRRLQYQLDVIQYNSNISIYHSTLLPTCCLVYLASYILPIFCHYLTAWLAWQVPCVTISTPCSYPWYLYQHGNSQIGAHEKSNLCYLTCLRLQIRLRAVTNRILLNEKTNFPSCVRNMF